MRIWRGYGSEHSANLVLVGSFVSSADAQAAERAIRELERQVQADLDQDLLALDGDSRAFTDGVLDLLQKLRLYSLSPVDIEQFAYEFDVSISDDQLVVRTDEVDVSAFIKLMIGRDAKVEIFSAHTFEPDGTKRRSGE